jgi:hypothetical protein
MVRRLFAAVVSLILACAAVPAFAYPDAQMEVVTRPDFGWLLTPPTWPGRGPGPCAGRGPCGPVGPGPGPCAGPGPGGPVGPGPCAGPGPCGPGPGWRPPLNRIVVDCDGWHGHEIERALSLLRPGGILVLRTHGRACREPIYIFRSVQIVGEGGPQLFAAGYDRAAFPLARAVLLPPPGVPCITVAPGVHAVSIRGLVINAPAAQGTACIQARDADVEVSDTIIRYEGLGSAINVEGGGLRLKNLGIAARTPAPAVISEGADVSFEDVRIATTQMGMLVEPGPGDSHLVRVFARALDGGSPDDAHPTTGLMVRGGDRCGHIDVVDAVMLGFSTGVRFDHDVKADLRYGRISWARVGVLTDGAVGVKSMTIGASEVGVYVRSGFAKIILNRIYGVHYAAIFADPGAKVWAEANWVYPGPDCGFLRDPRYNATGQLCRPWGELPEVLRSDAPYAGRFEDGWSEWNYDWGYDWRGDGWRSGPGYYDPTVWDARPPVFRGDYGYNPAVRPPLPSQITATRPTPTWMSPTFGTREAPLSPTVSTDLDRKD